MNRIFVIALLFGGILTLILSNSYCSSYSKKGKFDPSAGLPNVSSDMRPEDRIINSLAYYSSFESEDFTSQSLDLGSELTSLDVHPDSNLLTAVYIMKIRNNALQNNVHLANLEMNQLRTIKVMETLVKRAKDCSDKIERPNKLFEVRMYLSELYEQQSKSVNAADGVYFAIKSAEWEKTARTDPRQLVKKYEKKLAEVFPNF